MLICDLMTNKICKKCSEIKATSLFNKDSSRFDGISRICKECDRAKVLEWQIKNRDKHNKKSNRWKRGIVFNRSEDFGSSTYSSFLKKNTAKRFNITIDKIENMLISQSGRCDICENQLSGKKDPCIDHDRSCCKSTKSCGKCVRSMLCSHCNKMLGFARDNEKILLSAVKYLKRHKRFTSIT